jgi:hypothetical protein
MLSCTAATRHNNVCWVANSCVATVLQTSAGEHGILNVWDVNTAALGPLPSRQASFGSSSAAAAQSKWVHLVGDAALLEELRDYFCYAQLLAQPQDTAGAYDITGRHGCRPSSGSLWCIAAEQPLL